MGDVTLEVIRFWRDVASSVVVTVEATMELTGAVAEIAQLQQARRSCIVECMGCCSWLHLRTSYFHRRHPHMAERFASRSRCG